MKPPTLAPQVPEDDHAPLNRAVFAAIPDLRCTISRCTASGKCFSDIGGAALVMFVTAAFARGRASSAREVAAAVLIAAAIEITIDVSIPIEIAVDVLILVL